MKIMDGMVQTAEATRDAFQNMRKASDVTTDPDLIRYNSFKPEDFSQMMLDFGEEPVLEYIREMELKRLSPVK